MRAGKKMILTVAAALVVAGGLIGYVGGLFKGPLIQPGRTALAEPRPPERVGQAVVEIIPEYVEAVGTVRSRTETTIEAQVPARVAEVRARAGQKVRKGEVLVVLDSRELQARLDRAGQGLKSAMAGRDQARQAVAGAQAEFDRAAAEHARVQGFFKAQAATSRDLEQSEAAFRRAEAGVRQAKDGLAAAEAGVKQAEKAVEEAQIALSYATVLAPEDGEVARRSVEPGDLAGPGKPLLLLQTGQSLRLEALVRESLIALVRPGVKLTVAIDVGARKMEGAVEEVVPAADPQTRSFLVRVGIPFESGLYPGMFGRLLLPVGQQRAVLVPRQAVRRIGQMEVVTAKSQERWQTLYVQTGRALGDRVEILSGLKGGESVALATD